MSLKLISFQTLRKVNDIFPNNIQQLVYEESDNEDRPELDVDQM